MSKYFKVIIENGYQKIQTPTGEKLNCITMTNIYQPVDKAEAFCVFTILVNLNGSIPSCYYDHNTRTLSTPDGEQITGIDIQAFFQAGNGHSTDTVTAKCRVEFPYDTKHT